MYLPTPPLSHNYPGGHEYHAHAHNDTTSAQDSMEDSMLEITELEDEPLHHGGRNYPDNILERQHFRKNQHMEHPSSRILQMPSGLY